MKKPVITFMALWAALALVACAPVAAVGGKPATAATMQQLTKIDVCISSTSMFATPSAYALKYDIYVKHGLDVTLYAIEGGSDATVALLADEASICHIAGPPVVNAVLAGEDLVFVAGIGNRQTYSLIVRPEIELPQDLVGKVLAVSDPGSNSDSVLRSMLLSLGLQPDVDVTIFAVGGNSARMAAMESGQVAGTVLSLPESARAENMGYRVLLDPSQMQMDYQATAVVTKRSFLTNNRPTVVAYVKALTETLAQMKMDGERTGTVMVETLGLDPVADAQLIDRAYDRFRSQSLIGIPYPTRAGVQFIIDAARLENPNAPDLTADDVIDMSIVEELERSGFIAGLYEN